MAFTPREEQKLVLSYTGGTMGISAVPGSGKTFTLSALAADLIEKLVKSCGDQDLRPHRCLSGGAGAAARHRL